MQEGFQFHYVLVEPQGMAVSYRSFILDSMNHHDWSNFVLRPSRKCVGIRFFILTKANSWRWQGVLAKAYNLRTWIKAFQFKLALWLHLSPIASFMSAPNPPGGVNLTLAIFALVGATISIVGFIAHYIPRHQYTVFCGILDDIHKIFEDDDWQLLLPSDQRFQRYLRHVLHALLSPLSKLYRLMY